MAIMRMIDLELRDKRVLIRVDFNVPIKAGKITSEKRLLASVPTIQLAAAAGAKVIVLSHLGQPKEGVFDQAYSLEPVAAWLSHYFGRTIRLERDWLDGVEVAAGEIVLCENVRFNPGELQDDEQLAKKIAALGDVFVMDAFATAHRAQASTHGVAKFVPIACAGPLLMQELEALGKALAQPERPLLAITGGAKVSTKLQLLENLLPKVDQLVVGGGIANTFIAASGFNVGKSLWEPEFLDKARELLSLAEQRGTAIPVPSDVVVAEALADWAVPVIKPVTDISPTEMILDIGPETAARLAKMIIAAKTVVWNGPVGAFEFEAFSTGTRTLAMAVADCPGFTIAGGGDTVAAVEKFGVADRLSYISTAGGAFLEYLQGATLPAVSVLEQRGLKGRSV